MYIYYVYKNDNSEDRKLFSLKSFNIWALIFPFLWALYNRLWSVAIIIGIFELAIMIASYNSAMPHALVISFDILLHFFMAIFTAEIKEYYYHSIGYNLEDIFCSNDDEMAEITYSRRYDIV
jgi:hypothetical protein